METKSFEVMIHSQYAFKACKDQVKEYEKCRDTGEPFIRNPRDCKKFAKNLLGCYQEAEKVEPLCLPAFNDARECLFKSDGNLYNCQQWLKYYTQCQVDPVKYKKFLASATEEQKKPPQFNFTRYTGHYDRFA